MREFKEFPCTVFHINGAGTIKKVVITAPWATWSKSSGKTSHGCIMARECHPTFGAAVKQAKANIMASRKGLLASMKDLDAREAKINKQEQEFLLKEKKK